MLKEITAKEVEITVRNRLVKEKRDINVYHHFNKSAHIVSSNSSLKSGINMMEEDDYLHISVISGPGHLRNHCIMDLPSFMDFRFSSNGEVTLIHSGDRTLLRIPPGPPLWELKMTIPTRLAAAVFTNSDHITIGDAEEWLE